MSTKQAAETAPVQPIVRRFVLFPGYVISENDGERHYVSACQLRYLYCITRAARCVTFKENMLLRPGDIECHPRHDGKYHVFEI